MVQKRRWSPTDRAVRDILVFATGLVGAVHDIFTDFDKPYRFAFFGALMGLAVYLRANGRE